MALLVFVRCQPVHSCIEPSLHGLDFFLEIFLWRLDSAFFDTNLLTILLHGAAHVIPIDESSVHMCIDKWPPTARMLYPLSLPCKRAQAISPSYAQSKAQMNYP